MSIPVNALKADELLHYASFEPSAAELSRRFAEGSLDPSAESESLRDEIRMIEIGAEDLQSNLKIRTCSWRARRISSERR